MVKPPMTAPSESELYARRGAVSNDDGAAPSNIPELRDALKKLGRDDILIVAGGVIPPQDFEAVLAAGAAEIFPPGTVIPEAAERLLDRLMA